MMKLQFIFWALCLIVVAIEAAHLKARARREVVSYGECAGKKSNTNYPMSSRQRRDTTSPQFVTASGITGATTCGPIQSSSKIVGGGDASLKEYPWMVALVLSADNSQQCGGSLITDQWVLTAAHCFVKDDPNNAGQKIWDNKPDDWRFRVKVNDLTNTNNGATLEADTIVIHPNYKKDGSSDGDDFALVKLCSAVTSAGVVCLPDFDPAPAYHQKTCTVIGWGKISETGDQSPTLKEVDVTLTDPNQSSCSDTKDTICGAATGKDSCQGDSGGPLMCKVVNGGVERWAQVGVVSYGTGDCAQAGKFGVYGNTNKYKTWITDTITGY